jgi:3-oxoadipate enol-lactonase
MKVIDRGQGVPIVLVPGIQGRWEWMEPAVAALAARARVITFSLADEPTCSGEFAADDGFGCYVDQVAQALDRARVDSAVVCGVSYGGLIAAAFAVRYPQRVSAIVLVSALPPSWVPDARAHFYLRAPRLLSPLFFVASMRMYREIAAATPGFARGIDAAVRHGWRALSNMLSPTRVARRVRLLEPRPAATSTSNEGPGLLRRLGDVHVPALVITGEGALDRVVPVPRTLEYLEIWPHARHVTLERTGHLGLITRPQAFAEVVAGFADDSRRESDQRRRIG